MTTGRRRAIQITGGVTLVTLMTFGDWLLEKADNRSGQLANEITEMRFVKDSVAMRSDLNQILMEIHATNVQLIETNQRLREICERLQAGCR
jgi:translation initiation factor 2 gamma subunit (eIF-2gamma)